jgi:hypothetical protein
MLKINYKIFIFLNSLTLNWTSIARDTYSTKWWRIENSENLSLIAWKINIRFAKLTSEIKCRT